jgi:drug/metabolite transporter (DMT)-like permease
LTARRPYDPVLLGTLCGLFSAAGYTAANICLRSVAACDPIWVCAVKPWPTAVLTLPWLLWLAWQGRRVLPEFKVLAAIFGAGLVGQVAGNISFQWALGQIGLALAVPLCLGGMIFSAAVLGRLLLHEQVTLRTALSLGLLLLAVIVLSLGGEAAELAVREELHASTSPANPWLVVAGVLAGCFSGLAYSVLSVAIRYCVIQGASLPITLFTVSLAGILSLTLLAWLRIGAAGMLATSSRDLNWMLGAGVWNAISFLALTLAIKATGVVYVNALNATQALLAALAALVVFHEAATPWLAVGVVLTIAGLLGVRPHGRTKG